MRDIFKQNFRHIQKMLQGIYVCFTLFHGLTAIYLSIVEKNLAYCCMGIICLLTNAGSSYMWFLYLYQTRPRPEHWFYPLLSLCVPVGAFIKIARVCLSGNGFDNVQTAWLECTALILGLIGLLIYEIEMVNDTAMNNDKLIHLIMNDDLVRVQKYATNNRVKLAGPYNFEDKSPLTISLRRLAETLSKTQREIAQILLASTITYDFDPEFTLKEILNVPLNDHIIEFLVSIAGSSYTRASQYIVNELAAKGRQGKLREALVATGEYQFEKECKECGHKTNILDSDCHRSKILREAGIRK